LVEEGTVERRIIDFNELCERYPLRPWTVRTYCSQGKIPHLKIGRRVYFDVLAIDRWFKEHEKPAVEVRV
jgi:hypothetical protein